MICRILHIYFVNLKKKNQKAQDLVERVYSRAVRGAGVGGVEGENGLYYVGENGGAKQYCKVFHTKANIQIQDCLDD